MKTIEYRTKDKSEWGSGPWDEEPDKKQWQDEFTGLPCLIVRNLSGALCGYVGVPPSHSLHGKETTNRIPLTESLKATKYTSEAFPFIPMLLNAGMDDGMVSLDCVFDCHGGLTFSGGCNHGDDPAQGVCHIPGDGEPDDAWWFGFDCSHSGDYSPAFYRTIQCSDEIYRDFEYVTSQVTALAKQLYDWKD